MQLYEMILDILATGKAAPNGIFIPIIGTDAHEVTALDGRYAMLYNNTSKHNHISIMRSPDFYNKPHLVASAIFTLQHPDFKNFVVLNALQLMQWSNAAEAAGHGQNATNIPPSIAHAGGWHVFQNFARQVIEDHFFITAV